MPDSLSVDNLSGTGVQSYGEMTGVVMSDEAADWSKTIKNLMSLAKESLDSYDYDKALGYLETLEDIWDMKELPEFSKELRFELHREKGKAFASLGRLEEAIAEYRKLLSYCRSESDLATKSETFTQIGQLLSKQGDHDRALGFLQRALGAYRRLDDKAGVCRALRNLGVVYVELGEFEETESSYIEAMAIAGHIGDRILYADLVNNLGTIVNMKGNWKRAMDLYEESLEIYRDENEVRKMAYAQNNIAITLAEKGLNDKAAQYFQESYKTAVSIKDASLTLIVNINLADLNVKCGRFSDARKHCQLAEWYLKESNLINGHLAETKKISGKLNLQEDNYEAALKDFSEALSICREISARFLEAGVLHERGILYRAMDRNFDALADLEASFQIYSSLKADGKRDEIEEIVSSLERLYLEIFESMGRQVDQKDPYTKGHSDRVAALSLMLAKEVGLHTHEIKTVVAAGLLHDIGKLGIQDDILKKPGRLSSTEYKEIQKHSAMGVELLEDHEFPWEIKPLILHHHERIDGAGYPTGLKGEEIPLGARILCIADVFDALTSDRVYRKAFDTHAALEIMCKDAGKGFDSVLLKQFVSMIEGGKADPVINLRTRQDEMYSIWTACMTPDPESTDSSQVIAPGRPVGTNQSAPPVGR